MSKLAGRAKWANRARKRRQYNLADRNREIFNNLCREVQEEDQEEDREGCKDV